ncbi:hypothetical protein ACUNV4_11945 [Granulosicoccus sp. 3-233]|uniref:hypothetical protein n=1 Tax=Granulosicoccus sp. 3-233 TaxID=3417969 RepID=UPI003D3489C0
MAKNLTGAIETGERIMRSSRFAYGVMKRWRKPVAERVLCFVAGTPKILKSVCQPACQSSVIKPTGMCRPVMIC